MNSKPPRAPDAVMALAQAPGLINALRHQDLPEGLTQILALLAGEDSFRDEVARPEGEHASFRTLAENYVKAVLFDPQASPWRILGHNPGAAREDLRQHMRLLLLWLHPDHAKDEWQSAYARRIITAWQELSARPPEMVAPIPFRHNTSVRSFRRPWIAIPVERPPSRLQRSLRGSVIVLGILSFGTMTLVPDTHFREGIDAIAGWLPPEDSGVVASDEVEN